MKKQLFFSSLLIAMIITTHLKAQVSVLGNNAGGANYVGWANTVTTVPLEIRHNANTATSDINFLTRNAQRMQLNDNGLLGIGLTTQTLMRTFYFIFFIDHCHTHPPAACPHEKLKSRVKM